MKVYLVGFDNDGQAVRRYAEASQAVTDANGRCHLSLSHGNGAAFIVLTLPEDAEPSRFFPNNKAVEVGELAEKVQADIQALDEKIAEAAPESDEDGEVEENEAE